MYKGNRENDSSMAYLFVAMRSGILGGTDVLSRTDSIGRNLLTDGQNGRTHRRINGQMDESHGWFLQTERRTYGQTDEWAGGRATPPTEGSADGQTWVRKYDGRSSEWLTDWS